MCKQKIPINSPKLTMILIQKIIHQKLKRPLLKWIKNLAHISKVNVNSTAEISKIKNEIYSNFTAKINKIKHEINKKNNLHDVGYFAEVQKIK
jgi:hypothetical protein